MKPQKLRTFLVKNLRTSNKNVLELFSLKKIMLNGKIADASSVVRDKDEVMVDGKIIHAGKKLIYIKFYKPRGIESTMSKNIPNNLTTVFEFSEKLFPVGRLDKGSEGLIIFTNDGEYYKHITDKKNKVEKEYIVEVNKNINEDFLKQMRESVKIMGKLTLPAKVFKENEKIVRIILIEGLNRQIRRMCYKLGYEVVALKRIRIDKVEIGNLKVGKWEEIKN